MLRICLCLLFALASATVAAREVKLSSPNSGGGCPEKHSVDKDAAPASTIRSAAPARQTKAKPTVHSDAPSGRLQSPRWHSFLPGMFR